jgi:hypothetical protein
MAARRPTLAKRWGYLVAGLVSTCLWSVGKLSIPDLLEQVRCRDLLLLVVAGGRIKFSHYPSSSCMVTVLPETPAPPSVRAARCQLGYTGPLTARKRSWSSVVSAVGDLPQHVLALGSALENSPCPPPPAMVHAHHDIRRGGSVLFAEPHRVLTRRGRHASRNNTICQCDAPQCHSVHAPPAYRAGNACERALRTDSAACA